MTSQYYKGPQEMTSQCYKGPTKGHHNTIKTPRNDITIL